MTKHFSLLAILASAFVMVACGGQEQKPDETPTSKDPVLSIDASLSIEGKSGTYSIPYTLENPISTAALKTTTDCDWVYALRAETEKVMFKVSNNLGAARSTDINVTYGSDIKKTVALTQSRFEFESFDMEVTDIRAKTAKLVITPKTYKGNYFFEILSKARVDELNALDVNKIGEKAYGDGLSNDDLEWLKEMASNNNMSLESYLTANAAMYTVTDSGKTTEMTYSSLRAGKTYYALVYGLDVKGNRQTEVCFFEFTTEESTNTDLTFDDMISNVTQNSAKLTIYPSNDVDTYYWTYASETDMANYSLEEIMDNMIKNVKTYSQTYGTPVSSFLSKGEETTDIEDLSMGTSYTIIAWGMDQDCVNTTAPQQLSTFRTKSNEVTDDCTFNVEILEVEDMDINAKITPSNESTRYYIAMIDEKRCTNYSDNQMVQRILNMETQRLENNFYGTGVTWENHPDLYSGTQTKWGRKELGWTFEPEHSYRIYVFGVGNDGKCTTKIFRTDATTSAAEPSNMTFQVSLNSESTWHYGVFDITPSNDDDYYMPYLVKTSDLNIYRYADGSLMERELMDKIRDVYEDEISQNVFRKTQSLQCVWTSDDEYSLILFGYAGSNTTPMYEFKFHSPAIPFGKADCDISYTYELFNGADLYALDPVQWESSKEDCVMKVNITVTGNPTNYYFGLWPPKENYLSSGGIDHLVTLCQMVEVTGDNIVNKKFGLLKPWWGGASQGVFQTEEGEVLDAMPWSITAYAEDENHNYSPLHYELFINDQKPEDQVTGKYHKGYTKAYDFWSSPSSAPGTKTIILSASKPQSDNKAWDKHGIKFEINK